MTLVSAYCLAIESDIALDELPMHPGMTPDVTIRTAPVDPAGAPSSDTILLDVRGVARFAITGGSEIRVDPVPGASLDSVRLFLMGSALGALLHQRGLLVLHGNAVRVGDGCLVCVGASGAGKSTLAAALAARGYAPLADDVVAIGADNCALPGLPRIRLWKDAAERLGHDPAALRRIRPGFDKFALPAAPVREPLPVRWVFALDVEADAGVACTPLSGTERFHALAANVYRPTYLARTLGPSKHLELCAKLARNTEMFRIVRPAGASTLVQMVDTLLEHCHGTQRCA